MEENKTIRRQKVGDLEFELYAIPEVGKFCVAVEGGLFSRAGIFGTSELMEEYNTKEEAEHSFEEIVADYEDFLHG